MVLFYSLSTKRKHVWVHVPNKLWKQNRKSLNNKCMIVLVLLWYLLFLFYYVRTVKKYLHCRPLKYKFIKDVQVNFHCGTHSIKWKFSTRKRRWLELLPVPLHLTTTFFVIDTFCQFCGAASSVVNLSFTFTDHEY